MQRTIALALVVMACGPSAARNEPMGPADPCSGPVARCVGDIHQVCEDGTFRDDAVCDPSQTCSAKGGCSECDPDRLRLCIGDDLHSCNPDGTIGGLIKTCPLETCNDGHCEGDNECSASGVELIYVVDESYRLLSFNPAGDANEFKLIGNLSCAAGQAWAGGASTPFSMSVDRTARAWVLYSSGEVFWVNTADASCQPSSFPKGQSGFELFGMGFVSDSPGSDTETLFVAGGSSVDIASGNLGRVDATTLQLTSIASLGTHEYSPELTGTGEAELYGYYPGTASTFVAKLDKTTGQALQTWPLPALGNPVQAWAFAHWGGRFYIFVTTVDLFGTGQNSQVWRLDPMSGQAVKLLDSIPYIIVGAGVSTCAPVYIP